MLPLPTRHTLCSAACDLCGALGDTQQFRVKFRPFVELWACEACVRVHSHEALARHVRQYNSMDLAAQECLVGVDLNRQLRVRRSSGVREGGWRVARAGAKTIVFDTAMDQVRVCLYQDKWIKFVPLRALCALNPTFCSSSLAWGEEPHLPSEQRAAWEARWRDAVSWQGRTMALLFTFGDDVGRLIASYS